jgi:hypothetical protein
MTLADRLGEQVELQGIAYNAHAGAIVEVDGVPVYLSGIKRWPRGVYGVAATVSGRLTRQSLAPDPVPGPVVSHGMEGEVFVLLDPESEQLTGGATA